ncbi:MAG: hypothetical protein [Caudoviricetes sp.]|nr:MAG: hypothetical protein [Caudoviricetes sp.]
MLVKQIAKNGVVVNAIKDFSELTEEEKQNLSFAYSESKEDYKNYQVRYNKKGVLLGVTGYDFSEKMNAKIDEESNKPDWLDYLTIITPKAATRQQKKTAQIHFEQAEKLGF